MKALPLHERLAARTNSDWPLEPEPYTLLGTFASISNPPPKQRKRECQHQPRKTRQQPKFRQHAGHISAARQHLEQTFHAPSP